MPFAASAVALERVDGDVDVGSEPSPMSRRCNSIGASSFSPSPITTTPSMRTECSMWRIPSTAAWSAPPSPHPDKRSRGEGAGLGHANELERQSCDPRLMRFGCVQANRQKPTSAPL